MKNYLSQLVVGHEEDEDVSDEEIGQGREAVIVFVVVVDVRLGIVGFVAVELVIIVGGGGLGLLGTESIRHVGVNGQDAPQDIPGTTLQPSTAKRNGDFDPCPPPLQHH